MLLKGLAKAFSGKSLGKETRKCILFPKHTVIRQSDLTTVSQCFSGLFLMHCLLFAFKDRLQALVSMQKQEPG